MRFHCILYWWNCLSSKNMDLPSLMIKHSLIVFPLFIETLVLFSSTCNDACWTVLHSILRLYSFLLNEQINLKVSKYTLTLCTQQLQHIQCVPQKRKPINRVIFSENCNDLSEKAYMFTKFSLSFLLTPVSRCTCIGHAWTSTDHFKWWCQKWFAQNGNLRA